MTDYNRLEYNPSPLWPTDSEGQARYVIDELNKIAWTFANLDMAQAVQEVDVPPTDGPWPTPSDHGSLSGRTSNDQHPMSSITNLVSSQAAQDAQIALKNRMFFQTTQPTELESSVGDSWFVSGY